MMLSRKWTLAAIAAVSIAVAGCSSSGDKKVADTTTEPDLKPAAEKVTGLFATAQDARSKADGASEAAAQAVKDAKKYSTMFTTKAVHGVSATAEKNAQMVLDARDAAAQAVKDAEVAKGSAEGAKTEAGKLSADNPNKASLVAALDAAIKAAEEAIKAAEDSQKHADLKTAVAAVEGPDKKKPQTPADHGEMVAKVIAGALEPNNAGGGTRVMHKTTSGDSARPSSDKSHVMEDDHTGMTWAEIFGADRVRQERLGNQRTFIDVGPVTGMKATELSVLNTADLDEGGTIADVSYKGISGSVFCLRDKCNVEDGKLAGAWVFAPNKPDTYYVKAADPMKYTEETNYARFGHWLTVDNSGVATLNTYAWSNGNTTAVALGENKELGGTASYSGSAVGLSVHKSFDTQGEQTGISSGRFTADVELKAQFDATPTVEGTVSNFQGDAVDSTWEVTLKEMTLGTSRQASAGTTETGGTGANGQWNAHAYGMAGKRPTGIFGDFNAHWTDGHAAGAFATRKD